MPALFRFVLLIVLLQTLSYPVAAEEPVTLNASTAPSALSVSESVAEAPKKNTLQIDITKVCAIPKYPDAARRFGMHGKTILKLMIDDAGKISAFELLRSSGWKFWIWR